MPVDVPSERVSVVTRERTPRRRATWVVMTVLVGSLAVVAIGALLSRLDGPERVERVSVENPTGFEVSVWVEAPDGGRTELGAVAAGETLVVPDAVDQGDRWTVGFDAQGVHAGTITVPRRDGAVEIVVPPEAATRLDEAGATPDIGRG